MEYTQGREEFTVFKNNTQLTVLADQLHQEGLKDSLESIHDLIKMEDKEVKAMIETIQMRDKYELLKLKSIEKKKNETQELQSLHSGKNHIEIYDGFYNSKIKRGTNQCFREIYKPLY